MPSDNISSSVSDRRGFWSWLVSNKIYQSLSKALLGTKKRRFFLLLIVPVVWAFVANLGPIIKMVDISFYNTYPLSKGKKAYYTLDAWREFFSSHVFYIPFFRTLILSTALTFAALVITYPVAYFLARHVPKNKQMLFLLIILIPFWVGEIIRTYAIMILLGNNGAEIPGAY